MEVTIDGIKVTLDKPETALEAARRAGVTIPTLCWHPRVSVLGACRLCMIEVEGIPRLLAACTTTVSDGMKIITDTPQLRKVRETMLELLLCRHPFDCPTCVKGGECELQELAYKHSAPENRFPENPAPYPVKDASPFVERDSKKCLLCRRCVRVCREVRGVTVLAAMERGYHKTVGTFFQENLDKDFQEPYNCEFCGACVDICPVGALNSKVRKFRARTWEGEKTDSVCPFCSVGCLLTLQVKEGELVRTVPRVGPNNQDQSCFRGRFGTDYANSSARLITPLIEKDGKSVPAGKDEAVRALAGKLREAGTVEGVISSTLTMEEVNAAREFMKGIVPSGRISVVDTLGMEEEGRYSSFAGRTWDDLDEADLIFVAGQDFTVFEPVAAVRIRVSRQKSGSGLVVLDGRDVMLGREADLWLRPGGEGLPLLLGALIRVLAASYGERLKGKVDEALMKSLPGGDPGEVEAHLGLPEGSVVSLAGTLAEKEKVLFAGHRGWFDQEGLIPRLLAELDRLLEGDGSKGILYLGRDCNSRGAAAALKGESQESKGQPELMLIFGADPLGCALPNSDLAKKVGAAGTVATFDTYLTRTVGKSAMAFPLPHFAEKAGTFVSANGLGQQMSRAMTPPPVVAPLWDILDEIAEAMGKSLSFAPSLDAPTGAVSSPRDEGNVSPVIVVSSTLPEAGERCIVLRGSPLTDHRLQLVKETALILPGKVVEVNPADLESFGAAGGDTVRLQSGSGQIVVKVKSDLKTPPGQIHLPFDPADEECAAFVKAADRDDRWAPTYCRLTSVEKVASGEEG